MKLAALSAHPGICGRGGPREQDQRSDFPRRQMLPGYYYFFFFTTFFTTNFFVLLAAPVDPE